MAKLSEPDPLIVDERTWAAAIGKTAADVEAFVLGVVGTAESVEDVETFEAGARFVVCGPLALPLDIAFPVLRGEVVRQLAEFEAAFKRTDSAHGLLRPFSEGVLVSPGSGVLDDLAAVLALDPDALAQVLDGDWILFDPEEHVDLEGNETHAWLMPMDDRYVAWGVSARSVVVAPLVETDEEDPDLAWGVDLEGSRVVPLGASDDYGWPAVQAPEFLVLADLSQVTEAVLTGEEAGSDTAGCVSERRRGGGHDVRLSTANFAVQGVDLDFTVKQNGSVLGTLSVSRGGLQWRGRNRRRKVKGGAGGVEISWTEFVQWAESGK